MRAAFVALALCFAFATFAAITAITVAASAFARLALVISRLAAWLRCCGVDVAVNILRCQRRGFRIERAVFSACTTFFRAVTMTVVAAAIAVTTATALVAAFATSFLCWAFLARRYGLATHGCRHGGLVGQRKVLLDGIARDGALTATLTTFTAWALCAAAFTVTFGTWFA